MSVADIARYEAKLVQFLPRMPLLMRRLPDMREQFYSGEWLGEELQKAGFGAVAASEICFAHGQIVAQGGDCWEIASNVLNQSIAGSPPTPGAALSESLLKEAGLWNDGPGMIEFLASRGMTLAALDRLVDRWRLEPHYPGTIRDRAEPRIPEEAINLLLRRFKEYLDQNPARNRDP